MKATVGDVVLSCLPYAHVLMGKERGGRCDECFKEGSLREQSLNRCSKCKIAHYCSAKCQRGAWALHKAECEAFVRTKPEVPTESVRLLARLVLKYAKKEHLVKEKFKGIPGSRCFDDLVSHVEDLLSDPLKCQQFVTAWETLRMFLGPSFVDDLFPGDPRSAADAVAALPAIDPKSVDEDVDPDAPPSTTTSTASSILIGAAIYGRISVNSFSILDAESNPIGVGVYLPASKIDHACEGNVTPSFEGVRLNLRARANVENLSFSNLSLCYVEPLAPTWERKENLLSQYFFNCACSWCQTSSSSDEPNASVDASSSSSTHSSTSSSPRVVSLDPRLESFPLSGRDARMLSLSCGCAEKSCPKTGRLCSGVVELTADDGNSQSKKNHSVASPPQSSQKLTLSEHYTLDMNNVGFSECDLCFCSRQTLSSSSSSEVPPSSATSIMDSFVDVVVTSMDALKEIEEARKAEGWILRADDDRVRVEHFDKILTSCQKLLQRQSMFHPLNIFMLRALDQAFDVCVHLGKWKEALFYGQKTLAPFRFYHPNPHPTVALQVFKVAKLLAFLEPPSPSLVGLLADAVEMLRLTHGKPEGGAAAAAGRVTAEAQELLAQIRDEIRAQEDFKGLAIEGGEDSD